MKMKRFSLGILLIVLLFASISVFGVSAHASSLSSLPLSSDLHVSGGTELDADRLSELNELAKSVSESTGIGVYAVFSDEVATSVESAADTLLGQIIRSGGGYGDDNAGVILLVDLSNRTYAVVEKNNYGRQILSAKFIEAQTSDNSKVRTALQNGDYYKAAKTFINNVKDELNPNFFKSIWIKLLAALGIGGAVSGIVVGSHKGQVRTRRRHYLKDNAIQVLQKEERLVGTSIKRNAPSEKTNQKDHRVSDNSHGGSNTF